jgi:leucyl aminopeptidase
MKIKILKQKEELKQELNILVPIFEEQISTEKFTTLLPFLTPSKKLVLKELVKKWNFKGTKDEFFQFDYEENKEFKTLFLFGLGKKDKFKLIGFKRSISRAFRGLSSKKLSTFSIFIPWTTKSWKLDSVLAKTYLGVSLTNYKFNKYIKKEDDAIELKEVSILINSLYEKFEENEVKKLVKENEILTNAVNNSRDLLNETPMNMYPEVLKDSVLTLFKARKGVKVSVMNFEELKAKGMNLLAAVGMGSERKPYFVEISYKSSKKDAKTLSLVGKGITYDAGGYSLKSAQHMVGMHMDMGGATLMIGVMDVISNYKLDFNVNCYLVIAENLISGSAYKVSDIITGYGKKSVEILNTDAEGRLALADGISYACEKGTDKLIEASTLTGAVLAALGQEIAGIVTNNDDFVLKFKESYEKTEEKFWQLPAEENYKKLIKSKIADLKNLGGPYAGTITAGLFLNEFITEGVDFMHLDIAGAAMLEKNIDFYNMGGSGFGVQALSHFILKGKVF